MIKWFVTGSAAASEAADLCYCVLEDCMAEDCLVYCKNMDILEDNLHNFLATFLLINFYCTYIVLTG